jgi:hypothetical protein
VLYLGIRYKLLTILIKGSMVMNVNSIFNSMMELIRDKSWGGACYASAAIMHTTLKLAGIESTPCLGVVKCENGETFDHAWLEINGKIYDVAISFPLGDSKISSFVGPSGFQGVTSTPGFEYGIKMDLDPEAKFVAEKFSNIMEKSPFWETGCDYWDLTEFFAGFHQLTVDKDDLIKVVADSFWKVRCA